MFHYLLLDLACIKYLIYLESMSFHICLKQPILLWTNIMNLVYRIGSNEVMGCCALGPKHVGLGRDHWFEMLENPRKPVAQWYTLQEHVPFCTNESTMGKCRLNCQGQSRQSTVDSSEGSLYG